MDAISYEALRKCFFFNFIRRFCHTSSPCKVQGSYP
ncbi:hypothetical protein T10_7393 [Trichinella papuae]|uniref:Uncharacterized protein n=1 Tax=Trichinella papuae TaxID=268474 RepID=A0A0V1LXH8_9BILA|nr:hypothetical protein T10_7393 [Trichinella papuae]